MGGWISVKGVQQGTHIKTILQRNNTDVTLKKDDLLEAAKTSLYCIVCYKHPTQAKVTKWCHLVICHTCAKLIDKCPYRCNNGKLFLCGETKHRKLAYFLGNIINWCEFFIFVCSWLISFF